MKFKLNEDLFDDVVVMEVPEAEAPIVVSGTQRGPETPQEVGESSLILNAISDCANNIDNYNVLKVNLTDPDMIKVIEDIADMENYKLGKLQSLLKKVSPNAESIMNGAVEAEEQVAQDTPDIQLESLKEDWKDGELTKQELSDWDWEMTNTTYRVERSIKRMLDKHPEYRDEILSTAKNCRNILSNLCSLYNESLNEGDWEDPEWRKYYGVDDDSFYDGPPVELEPEETFDDYDDDWDSDEESLNEDRLPVESLEKKNEGFKPLQVTSSDYNNDSNKNNIMEDIANEQVNIEDVDDEF